MADAGQAAGANIVEDDGGRGDPRLAGAARSFLAAQVAAQIGDLAEQFGAFGFAEAALLQTIFEAVNFGGIARAALLRGVSPCAMDAETSSA